ncbi:MAG: hypothetical protein ACKVOR_09145 [Flavobacteriales bacterium]
MLEQGEFYAMHYNSIHDVPQAEWNKLAGSLHAFLSPAYLSSLEDAHDSRLDLRYAMFKNGEGQCIGIAAFQITHFITSESAYGSALIRRLSQLTRYLRKGHIHNILIAGNTFATGRHGFQFIPAVHAQTQAHLVLDAMMHIAAQEKKQGRRICAMLAKDFYPPERGLSDALANRRFSSFSVDHNMVMPVLSEWKTFEDYLSALNTKFRTKAKASLKRSAELEIKLLTAADVHLMAARMQQLYEDVHEKADFKLGKMNVLALAGIISKMPDTFCLKGFFYQHELVGFSTAMRCGNSLEAHVIGIDYERNKVLGIYQRMLYEYVNMAIEQKCTNIVFGRTAAEIKSTVGAFPVDLTISVFHNRRISNALLNLILGYVKPTPYAQREPWRAEVLPAISQIALNPIHQV